MNDALDSGGKAMLTYECDCGRRTSEARETCRHCGRPNPEFNPSPSFMGGGVSQKSVIENRGRAINRMRTDRRVRQGS